MAQNDGSQKKGAEPHTEEGRQRLEDSLVKGGVNVDRFGGAKIDQLAGIQRFAWDGWNGA